MECACEVVAVPKNKKMINNDRNERRIIEGPHFIESGEKRFTFLSLLSGAIAKSYWRSKLNLQN